MKRWPPGDAFTLAFTRVEMLVAMAVVAILAGMIVVLNAMAQPRTGRCRVCNEIKFMSAACEAYKADNGRYPQGSPSTVPAVTTGPSSTDQLDPNPLSANSFATADPNPNHYQPPSTGGSYPVTLFLWQQLSGHLTTTDSTQAPTGTNYAGDFFRPAVLSGTKNSKGQMTQVNYILDPFGNPYGYSTAGLYAEQNFRANHSTNGTTTSRETVVAGFNTTFDMWSTAGATTWYVNASGQSTTSAWVRNW
jgi:type II secretory pathway pseudopilin PulG